MDGDGGLCRTFRSPGSIAASKIFQRETEKNPLLSFFFPSSPLKAARLYPKRFIPFS